MSLSFEDFYSYDRHFRQRIANEPSLHWDRIDQELFAQHMRTLKVVCFKCRNFGHVANNNCDFSRPNSSQPAVHNSNFRLNSDNLHRPTDYSRPSSNFRAPTNNFRSSTDNFRASSNSSRVPFSAPTCFYFNTNGFCNNVRCIQSHSCSSCGGKHSNIRCSNQRQFDR